LAPLISILHCGHSNIRFSKEYEDYLIKEAKLFPLSIKIINGKAFVYKDIMIFGIPAGSEITEMKLISFNQRGFFFLHRAVMLYIKIFKNRLIYRRRNQRFICLYGRIQGFDFVKHKNPHPLFYNSI
jgi:hypothetical protein